MSVRIQRHVLGLVMVGMLAACGGGDDDEGPAPNPTPQSPVGVFSANLAAPGATTPMLGMVLPPAAGGKDHVYYFARQTSGLSTDYDALFGTMTVMGSTFVSYDGRYYLSQENRQVGGIRLSGSAQTKKSLLGRYTDPHNPRSTQSMSLDYQANSYDRLSDLGLIKGVYQSAGSYFGNSWSLTIGATGAVTGTLSGGCAIKGQIGLMDTSKGAYQVTHLDLSGSNCDRNGKEFSGVAALQYDAFGNKSGIWLLTVPKDIASAVKPVVLVGELNPDVDPTQPTVEAEGLWIGSNQNDSRFNGVVLPNDQYFFYGADGTVLYGTFSAGSESLQSTNGVYLGQGQGVRVEGVSVRATATSAGMSVVVAHDSLGTPQTLTFATEKIGATDLYNRAPSLNSLIGTYNPPGGFGSTGIQVQVSKDESAANVLKVYGQESAQCALTGFIRPFGAGQHNLFNLELIYEGEQCGTALKTQQKQGGVAVATFDAGGVSGLRLLALGESNITNERLYTVYEGARQ